MKNPLPYPPPWQDAPTLCAHLCISEGTLDNHIRKGLLPPARMWGGKRMWEWSEVEGYMRSNVGKMEPSEAEIARRVHDVTKQAAGG